ncbi:hypothetical protein FRC04_005308 [Tulasnella sp. 424]|nr:hypothetical protein FRC04_005308 [Tulasnella sp. 424]
MRPAYLLSPPIVVGQPMGFGTGHRKKIARDQAAHQALAIMGIIQPGDSEE